MYRQYDDMASVSDLRRPEFGQDGPMEKGGFVPMTAESEWILSAALDEAGFDTRDGFGRKTATSVMQLPI